MDWREAREECWRMGGELAFPLPKKDCPAPTYVFKKEEVYFLKFYILICFKDFNFKKYLFYLFLFVAIY